LVIRSEELDQALALVSSTFDYAEDDHYASDEAPVWVVAPVAGGLLVLCCLFLILVIILRAIYAAFDKGERSGGGGSRAAASYGDVIDPEKESKGYGGRGKIGGADTSDKTNISFPDTQISRLSITHNEAVEAVAPTNGDNTKRKHPIMTSTSSSFRDYRNEDN